MSVERKSKMGTLAAVLQQIVLLSEYPTQAELAKKLGLSKSALSNYFHDQGRIPEERFLIKLVKVCGRTPRERARYSEMLKPALLWKLFPKFMAFSSGSDSFPSGESPLVFRNQVRKDLDMFTKRRVRQRLRGAGVPFVLVQGMLDGRWNLNRNQVRKLAKALGADEARYLSLMKAPSDYAGELAADEQQLLTGLASMSKASQKDIKAVQGRMRRRASPRSRPGAGSSTVQ